ncbi:MAG: FeoA family protein [Chloroflexi bacterium]|nr:FeoA family protein [Chloroflexota bacterium]
MNRQMLSGLEPTGKGRICEIHGDYSFHCFLMQNGLIEGKNIELYKVYSDNYLIKIDDDDSYFVVNKKAADNIIIEIKISQNLTAAYL